VPGEATSRLRRKGLRKPVANVTSAACRPAQRLQSVAAPPEARTFLHRLPAMLAYRHAFHAGNHADVLKHLVLIHVLKYMTGKDKPLRVIDTHAGAGGYLLGSPEASKKGEYLNGVKKVWDAPGAKMPPAVIDYLKQVRAANPPVPGAADPISQLHHYPGSPQIAQRLLRAEDELRLHELHPTDHRLLAQTVEGNPQVTLYKADGFDSLRSQLPSPSRRALVLMDPSYELVSDYAKVVGALREGLERMATTVFVVWYPQVSRREAAELPRRLKALSPKGWLHVRLTVQQPDQQGFGLVGSGCFIINPPFTLAPALREALPWLVSHMKQFEGAAHILEEKKL
jgi:23S rRNA (adenine2030-N6)-methyltransferase